MLTKFDIRSSRVKAVCFHKTRPLVLCGLHNGSIQMWDYRLKAIVDTFSEHAGPVRGIDFHDTQPLFVSGADDLIIKVWNYKLRRCLFSLSGHVDYIRTTFFHPVQPWIVSCSDDMTVRIWNWQSRSSVATLSGHKHYVMCAQFHPREDLVVSASLDKTIRLWNVASVRQRKQENSAAQDLLGSSDVALVAEILGHDKGVNWVSFHPTKRYILSAADDRTVAVWMYNAEEGIAAHIWTGRGHVNNVCCALFFKNFIVSCSEDRTIRVWEARFDGPTPHFSSTTDMVFRRDSDRFWILASLPEQNLIAAGHDTGLLVFKLFRERPATQIVKDTLYYIHDNSFVTCDLSTCKTTHAKLPWHLFPPITISMNPGNKQVAACYREDGGSIELFGVPRPGTTGANDVQRFVGSQDAVFFGPNKYAVVGRTGLLTMVHAQQRGDSDEKCLDFPCSRVFPGPPGCVVCQAGDKIYLYQIAQHGPVAEAVVPNVRYVVWDREFHRVAFLSKTTVTVMTKKLRPITTVSESFVHMKSVAFDETREVMYFTTSNHLKFCNLRNGETGTISSLRHVAYLVRAVGNTVWILLRSGIVTSLELENRELTFKLKLQQQSYRDIIRLIQRKDIKGQAMVGYLHKRGHADIALHFVSDPFTRFNLAIECGAVDIAKAAALELNDGEVWRRLAEIATKFGDIQLAQFASAKAGNHYGGAMLALVTGNLATVGHLIDSTDDTSFKLQYGLYTGDVDTRIRALADANQLPLAYAVAKSNGRTEAAEALLAKMPSDVAQRAEALSVKPPAPVAEVEPRTENWPLLRVEDSVFARLLKEPSQFEGVGEPDLPDAAPGAGWADDDDLFGAPHDSAQCAAGDDDEVVGGDAQEGGGWDDDLEIDINVAGGEGVAVPGSAAATSSKDGDFVVPQRLPSLSQHWVDLYAVPAFHVAAGSFSTAFELLKRQIALSDPAPLKPYMLQLWTAVNPSRPSWDAPSQVFSIARDPPLSVVNGSHAPALPDYMPVIKEQLAQGYQKFVEGRFADALTVFESILHRAVVTTVRTEQNKAALREVMQVAPEYCRALALQLHLRTLDPNSDEVLALSMYFTHFKLHRPHLMLALTQAMSKAYKKKNLRMAASVARRLVDQDPPQNRAQQAAAIIAEADRNPTDAVSVDYDERNPFALCSVSLKPLYEGASQPVRCAYCHSPAARDFSGTLCPICKIATFGTDCAGLNNQC